MRRPRARIAVALAGILASVAGCGQTGSVSPGASLSPALATFEDAGFAFDYPASWTLHPTAPIDDPSGSTREAVLGTLAYSTHCGTDALDVGCVLSQPMTPDTVALLVGDRGPPRRDHRRLRQAADRHGGAHDRGRTAGDLL